MEKICNICKISKPVEGFYKRGDSKDGYRNDCIVCHLEKKMIYSKENSQHKRDYMKQYRIDKPDVNKVWNENNPQYKSDYMKQYRIDNPEKTKEHKNNNRKKRLATDPQYRLKNNIRRLILLSFSKKGYSKKSKTNEILGVDYPGFISHIESQFTEGMSWENRGLWELDHIIPISLGKTEDEIVKLNHYSNFQPLWREDNIKKGNKILVEIHPLFNGGVFYFMVYL